MAKHRAFPWQGAVRCGGVRDLQRLSALQPGWRAPNQLPPHQLGPVRSVTAGAERGLGNAAQCLPGVWSGFWSPRPALAPSPSQLARISPAKDASLADSSNDSSFQGRAGWEDRGRRRERGDPGWASDVEKCPNKVMGTARGRQQLAGHLVQGARGAFGEAPPPKRSGCWEAGEQVRDGVGWASGVEQHPGLLWGGRAPPGSVAPSVGCSQRYCSKRGRDLHCLNIQLEKKPNNPQPPDRW